MAQGDGVCSVEGSKTASPETVFLGDAVTVTLTLSGTCPPRPEKADVMLVWDPYATFWYDYPYARAQEAMTQLAIALEDPSIRVGAVAVVTGTTDATIVSPLGSDTADTVRALESVARHDFDTAIRVAAGESTWPDAVRKADEHLSRQGSQGAERIIVFVGIQLPTEFEASAAAFASAGGVLKAVQVPWRHTGAMDDRLPATSDVVQGSHAGDIADVVRGIHALIATPRLRDVTVLDRVSQTMDFVEGSAVPAPSVVERLLVWDGVDLPEVPRVFSNRLRPQSVGRYPTNDYAEARYTDADGSRRTYSFPEPMVEVLMRPPTLTATALPTQRPTPRPTSTSTPAARSTPRPLYLPLVVSERCVPGRVAADIALVIDASTSMRNDHTLAGRTKLQAAVEAATSFVRAISMPQDRVAVVVFNENARVIQGLTERRVDVEEAIRYIPSEVRAQTRIDLGIHLGRMELTSPNRDPRARPVMIVLTDGLANPAPAQQRSAERERPRTTALTMFSIGLAWMMKSTTPNCVRWRRTRSTSTTHQTARTCWRSTMRSRPRSRAQLTATGVDGSSDGGRRRGRFGALLLWGGAIAGRGAAGMHRDYCQFAGPHRHTVSENGHQGRFVLRVVSPLGGYIGQPASD